MSRLERVLILSVLILCWCGTTPLAGRDRPNILFIAVDDLNDWVGVLGGHPQAQTPRIDRLAERGLTFTRAYCASPLCGPSRAALLYGIRPSSSGSYGHQDDHDPRKLLPPDVVSLPRAFQRGGYYTAGCGKIFHGKFHDPRGWDEYQLESRSKQPDLTHPEVFEYPLSFGPVDGARDEEMGDMQLARWAARRIEQARDRPFFIAVGFRKPHLPWYAPRRYYDLHPLSDIQLPEVREDDLLDVPPIGRFLARPGVAFSGPEAGDHHEIVRLGLWKRAVQAYLATCSFVDSCVGVVLDALERSGEAENTIVVLWGDHGWHLGEKLHWRKHALWEEASRTTLIISAPGLSDGGGRCRRIVGLPDLYPTLVELGGLPPVHVEAQSLRPLLLDPEREWTRPALTTFGPGNHAVRDERWRYIRYADGSEELYDHERDPGEFTNLAGRHEFAEVKSRLARWMPAEEKEDPASDSAFRVLRTFLRSKGR